ncbi:MAG: thioredoxin family protein [Deferribacteres bacterium]|nr:thioredoxin family protein [candidate division KSB1 bacterium]MCB9501055.1 thioredoxin family protein [Deferribacteres bacterium]
MGKETSKRHYLLEANFQMEVLQNPKPTLVEIGADWCGGCEIMAPVLERLAVVYTDRITFRTIDIEANETLAREYGVSELPFLLLFKNGHLVDHVVGVISAKELEDRLKNLLMEKENSQ